MSVKQVTVLLATAATLAAGAGVGNAARPVPSGFYQWCAPGEVSTPTTMCRHYVQVDPSGKTLQIVYWATTCAPKGFSGFGTVKVAKSGAISYSGKASVSVGAKYKNVKLQISGRFVTSSAGRISVRVTNGKCKDPARAYGIKLHH